MLTFENVNVTALATAANFVMGAEAYAKVQALYKIIDNAMFNAYQLGVTEAQEGVEAKVDEAFDNGFNHGAAFMVAELDAADADQDYDEGYLQGVADARARPEVADAVVHAIIQSLDANAINGEFDIDNVTDSGDEQPHA